jgi:hypothetical protein
LRISLIRLIVVSSVSVKWMFLYIIYGVLLYKMVPLCPMWKYDLRFINETSVSNFSSFCSYYEMRGFVILSLFTIFLIAWHNESLNTVSHIRHSISCMNAVYRPVKLFSFQLSLLICDWINTISLTSFNIPSHSKIKNSSLS